MSNPETYMAHQLNNSKSKQAHIFPKQQRFPSKKRHLTEVFYDVPSTKSRRSTSFGIGNKISLVNKQCSPPPGTYQSASAFEKRDYHNTTSIGEGRQKVTFGSFLLNAIKKSKDLPSPDKYTVKIQEHPRCCYIGSKIDLDFALKQQKLLPGPGAYKLNVTQMNKSGSYILSNFKNHVSPRYHTDSQRDKQYISKRVYTSVTYDIEEKQIGKFSSSKYKNVITPIFSKSQRPGLADKSKKFVPGFKYRRFSQFGGNFI